MEEEIENLDSANEEEVDDVDVDLDEDLEDTIDPEKEELRKKLEESEKQRDQLYARLKKDAPEKKSKKVEPSDDAINRILDQRDLDEMDLSDELKTEVQDYAKLKGISVKKAALSPYITFRKEQVDKKTREDEAALGSKSRAKVKRDYSTAKPSDFDLSTEEGRADFAKYEDHLRKQLG